MGFWTPAPIECIYVLLIGGVMLVAIIAVGEWQNRKHKRKNDED